MKRPDAFHKLIQFFAGLLLAGLIPHVAGARLDVPRAEASNKSIKISITTPIRFKDPMDLTFIEEWEIAGASHDTLVMNTELRNLRGVLADRWELSPTGEQIDIFLKPGLKFSDGSPLDSFSVEYSFKRLLLLDKDNSLAISRCLKPSPNFRAIHDRHGSILPRNPTRITFLLKGCGKSLLNEMVQPHYAIVSPKAVEGLKVKSASVVSGAFIPLYSEGMLRLYPNLNNWRFRTGKYRVPASAIEITSTKSPKGFVGIADATRVRESADIKEFVKSGYSESLSLPVMTWYLTIPAKRFNADEGHGEILKRLRAGLNPKAVPALSNNELEIATDTFFPKELNCSGGTLEPVKASTKPLPQLAFVRHRTGEDEKILPELVAQANALGYQTRIVDDLASVSTGEVPIVILRLFTGDDLSYVFSLIFDKFRSIPDPGGQFAKMRSELENSAPDQAREKLAKMCEKFAQHHYVPVAHRKVAFVYKDSRLARLFSRQTGNFNYLNLLDGGAE